MQGISILFILPIMLSKPTLNFELSDSTSFEMVFVEGGRFLMGVPENDPNAAIWAKPHHIVELSSFYLGKYPVTQKVWKSIVMAFPGLGLDKDPSLFKSDQRPVDNICFEEIIQKFLPALGQLTKSEFRLPTEAEWEYAARGGKYNAELKYSGSDHLKEVGWFRINSHGETKDVGQKQPNELGIFDMSGNALEFCKDILDHTYYTKCSNAGVVKDPCNTEAGTNRVLRGGNYSFGLNHCRTTARFGVQHYTHNRGLGFRLALSNKTI